MGAGGGGFGWGLGNVGPGLGLGGSIAATGIAHPMTSVAPKTASLTTERRTISSRSRRLTESVSGVCLFASLRQRRL
jgi:hypothetical protein